MAQNWRVVITPAARLEHHMSPVERLDQRRRARRVVYGRYLRVQKRVGRNRPAAFWFATIGQIKYLAIMGLLRGSRHTVMLAVATAQGVLDGRRGRPGV
jgi:hypothetical protein